MIPINHFEDIFNEINMMYKGDWPLRFLSEILEFSRRIEIVLRGYLHVVETRGDKSVNRTSALSLANLRFVPVLCMDPYTKTSQLSWGCV